MAEVFYFASKAVLHPTAPLYDVAEHVRACFDRSFLFQILSWVFHLEIETGCGGRAGADIPAL